MSHMPHISPLIEEDSIRYELLQEALPLPALSSGCIPFRAQHLILQAIQGYLEQCTFDFVRRWLPRESLSAGWTCPESVELHRIFSFLDEHKAKSESSNFHGTFGKLYKWRRPVTSIRHAAVHRIVQDRDSLDQKIRAAAGFAQGIGGPCCSRPLERLRDTLGHWLVVLDDLSVHLKEKAMSQLALCRSRPQHRTRRLTLLPEAVKRVSDWNEQTFTMKVESFLRTEFP
ncbi:hypothetical protein N7490_006531 [Penicillium lividum]|nr:hypothetical protein N7490_006531 [Penicillium lividum]